MNCLIFAFEEEEMIVSFTKFSVMRMFALITASVLPTYGNSCVIVGSIGIQTESSVGVRVFEETPEGRNGRLILERYFKRGDKVPVTVSNGRNRIRYEYKLPLDTEFHSNTGYSCRNNEEVKVP